MDLAVGPLPLSSRYCLSAWRHLLNGVGYPHLLILSTCPAPWAVWDGEKAQELHSPVLLAAGAGRHEDVKGAELSCGQLQRPPGAHTSLVKPGRSEMHLREVLSLSLLLGKKKNCHKCFWGSQISLAQDQWNLQVVLQSEYSIQQIMPIWIMERKRNIKRLPPSPNIFHPLSWIRKLYFGNWILW